MDTAFVFPGGGSQFVGMGRDLYAAYPEARRTFEEADEALGFALSTLCFEGPEEVLTDTLNAQPAIFTVSIACLRALEGRLPWQPAYVAGHSSGEYAALVAADALDFADGIRLIRERGRVMQEAGEKNPGGMAAIMGIADEVLDDICRESSQETGQVVQVANYNSPGQVVISGHKQALQMAIARARERGAKRVIELAVTVASHSPLMAEAARALALAVERTPIHAARVPIIGNVSARPIRRAEEIRAELVAQLTSPVRWVESVHHLARQGVKRFVEFGPKNVLTGLIRRTEEGVELVNVGDAASVAALRGDG